MHGLPEPFQCCKEWIKTRFAAVPSHLLRGGTFIHVARLVCARVCSTHTLRAVAVREQVEVTNMSGLPQTFGAFGPVPRERQSLARVRRPQLQHRGLFLLRSTPKLGERILLPGLPGDLLL